MPHPSDLQVLALLLGFAGGVINALAGGGPIIVVAALAAFGIPADVASLTSTVALLPGQFAAGWRARVSLPELGSPLRRRIAVAVSLAGGAAGAALLLATPSRVFAGMLPWLIGFATLLYAWSSRPKGGGGPSEGLRPVMLGWLVPLAVYGGFYGGGNSFMVLALLAWANIPARVAAHAKNLLVMLMNLAAAVIFLASGRVDVGIAIPLAIGALLGSATGVRLIDRIDPVHLRRLVIVTGSGLAVWLALTR